MSTIGFPLLLIPLAICNILVFLMPGVDFDAPLAQLTLLSGASFTPRIGELLVALGVLLLLPEVVKGARPGAKYVTDHLLSLLVFGGAVAEFLLLPPFGNATVLLLALLALVDFLSGIALRNRRRPAATAKAAKPGKAAKPVAPEPAAEPEVAVVTPEKTEPLATHSAEPEPVIPPEPVAPAPTATPQPVAVDAPHAETPHATPVDAPQLAPPDLQDEPPRKATPSAH